MPVYAVLWYYSDVLFDAKCDTDNAGELLETPTKLGCRILTENKGNPHQQIHAHTPDGKTV